MATIKIKCPVCGAVLTVMDDPANQGKSVRCPVCKEKSRFADFKTVAAVEEMKTEINRPSSDDATLLSPMMRNLNTGYLSDERTKRIYPLKAGHNLVGRMPRDVDPVADVPIDTDDMGMSRRHFYIDVNVSPEGAVKHYAYRAENKNATYINGAELCPGDKIVLHDGDNIKTSDTTLIIHLEEF